MKQSLEEATNEYMNAHPVSSGIKEAFKAGAEWIEK